MKKSYLILASILLFICISCKKTLDFNELKTEEVQSSHNSSLNLNERTWFEKKYKDINLRYAGDNKKTLLWDKSYHHNFEFGRALVVPILFDQNYSVSFIKNKQTPQQNPKTTLSLNSLNYLLIKEDINNQYSDELVNLIPEENYTIKLLSKKSDISFDGIIQITDWSNNFKKGYFIENGKIKGNAIDSKKNKALLLDCYETSYYLCPPENLSSTGEIFNYAGCSYLYSSSICFNMGSSGNDGGTSYSDILGYYSFETPVEKTRKLATKIPSAYKQLYTCTQFSNALKKAMQMNNIAGKVLQVKTNVANQNIFSSLYPNAAISVNGFHQAIQVGDTVFDNMNPNGIDYNSWYNALAAINGFYIITENF